MTYYHYYENLKDSLVPQGTLVVPEPTPVKEVSPATASTTR